MGKNNNSNKLKRYYKHNMAKVFLIGILCGAIFMAIHVVVGTIDSQKFSIKYTAAVSVSYDLKDGENKITSQECLDIISSTEYATQMKAYLGSYVTYEQFLSNLKFDIKNSGITIYYTDESQVRAKRIVNTVSGKICNYFYESNKVAYIGKSSKTTAEEIKVLAEKRIKLGITYFTEIGLVVGWILGYIILTKGGFK